MQISLPPWDQQVTPAGAARFAPLALLDDVGSDGEDRGAQGDEGHAAPVAEVRDDSVDFG